MIYKFAGKGNLSCTILRRLKRTTLLTLGVVLILSSVGINPCRDSYAEVYPAPEIVADAAVLINADTGEVLYEKNKDEQHYPASTTKIMTALLTLENLNLDDIVTVSHNAAFTEGSRVYLLEGEKVTVEELLYALMLESGNDAAIALAEANAGSVDAFADMMNSKAIELGGTNTYFVSPNGLPNEAHVVSAYDMALYAREAMKNEMFRKLVSTYKYDMGGTNLQAEARHFYNSNRLLYDTKHTVEVNGVTREIKYEGILGIKTGFTNAAQACLVAGAERDGAYLISVVLHTPRENLYSDSITLLDYGFDNFAPLQIIKAGTVIGDVRVKKGSPRNAEFTIEDDITGLAELSETEPLETSSAFTYETELDKVTAPLDIGDKVGLLKLFHNGTEVAEYDLVAAEPVDLSLLSKIASGDSGLGFWAILILVTMGLLALVYMSFVISVRRRARKAVEIRRAFREQRERDYADDDFRGMFK